jgi:hypothetical protein
MVVDEKQQSYPQVIHSQEKVIHRISTELSTMENR